MKLDGFDVCVGDVVWHCQYGSCLVLRTDLDSAIVKTCEGVEVIMRKNNQSFTWHNVMSIRPPKCNPKDWEKIIKVAQLVQQEFITKV